MLDGHDNGVRGPQGVQLLRRGVTVRRELLLDLVLCAWSDDYYDMWEVRGVEVED